jgi:hypothetical protein
VRITLGHPLPLDRTNPVTDAEILSEIEIGNPVMSLLPRRAKVKPAGSGCR